MSRAIVLQHVPHEGPGRIVPVFRDFGIPVEVRKLYPEAELPSFQCDTSRPGSMRLTYQSTRPFAPLAEGLLRGCLSHYGEVADVDVEDLSAGAGTAARFLITHRDAAT